MAQSRRGEPVAFKALQYRFVDGAMRGGVSANALGNTVERLRQEHDGVCPPKALVDASRDKAAPTHPLFEWDDATAAEEYRTDQARGHIRDLRVLVGKETPADQLGVNGPIYVSIESGPAGEEHGYTPVWLLIQNKSAAEQVLTQTLAQLQALQRRYEYLQQLRPDWVAVRQAAEMLEQARRATGAVLPTSTRQSRRSARLPEPQPEPVQPGQEARRTRTRRTPAAAAEPPA